MAQLPFLSGMEVAELASAADAVGFLDDALRSGAVDPERDSPRLFSPAPDGEFLMMPTGGPQWSGIKLITIAPGNPARGKPKIQGHYTLIRSDDLQPVVLMDGVELTLMRTPAVTVLAVRQLLAAGPARPDGALPVVVFGTGPQAERHLQCLAGTVGPLDAVIVGRRSGSAEAFVDRCAIEDVQLRTGTAEDVRTAAVILCVTSSSVPVFDGSLVPDDAVVAAVGSHGTDKAELPADLVRRADVTVEARASAMRESGDLLQARTEQEWEDHSIGTLAELATGQFTRTPGKPAVFSGVGMAWEDLVIASSLWERHQAETRRT